jgi:hypothetical protein
MGLSNVLFIVVPRALALMIMTALYNVSMIVFTTLSGFFIAVAVVGVNPGAFVASFFTQGTLVDLFGGEIKCILFGALVAAICIYKGISAKGGAEGVARAVHSGVVWCFAIGLILLVLLLGFRQVRPAILAVLPTVIAAGAATGLLFLVGALLNPRSSPITILLGGVVVASATEFSVLWLARYPGERAQGIDAVEAAHVASTTVGPATAVLALLPPLVRRWYR